MLGIPDNPILTPDQKRFLQAFSMSPLKQVYYLSGGTAEILVDEILIDSLQDILANKIMALTDRLDAKDYVYLYCALIKHPEIKMEQLVAAAEKKFGVNGVGHILQGRFLGDIPGPEGLFLRDSLDPRRYVAFFRNQAKAWIASRIAGPTR